MSEEIKAELESLGGIRRKMTVTVPAETVDRGFGETYRGLQKKVNLPGYRKGHVPMRLVKQMFAAEVKDDVARDVISRAYEQALHQTGAEPVGSPDVKEFKLDEGQPLTFTAEFEIKPRIELPAYKGLKLDKEIEEVGEEDVVKVLEDLRRKVAPVRDVADNRAVAAGDIVVVDFEGFVEGQPLPGGKGVEYPIEVGSDTFIHGFEENLIGLAAGGEKMFILTMPPDYRQEDLAGKEVQFSVKVKAVKERVLPPLDDDFAKDVGEYAGLDDLKAKVKHNMAGVREKEAMSLLKQQAVEQLSAAVTFELPATLVEMEEGSLVRDWSRRLAIRGIPPEETAKQLEALKHDINRTAAANVKISLLLAAIAKQEDIKVTKEDLDRSIKEMADRYKKPVGELRKEMISSGAMESVAQIILEEKTLDFILGQAAVTVKAPAKGKGGKA